MTRLSKSASLKRWTFGLAVFVGSHYKKIKNKDGHLKFSAKYGMIS